MATQAIISPDEVAKLVPQVVSQAQAITVTNNDDYEMACSFLTFVATRKRQVDEVFDPIVKKAHETHKEAVAQKKKVLDPLLLAEMNVKGKLSTYTIEQERIRKAEEDRLAKIAKDEADARALAEAQQLEDSGDKELADLVLENASAAPAPVVVLPPSVPKFSGVAMRETWAFRIDDEMLIPREYLMVNESAIRAVVRAHKNMTKIPGVSVFKETGVAVRSR